MSVSELCKKNQSPEITEFTFQMRDITQNVVVTVGLV
jgi:hypothetical protein